jgi:hypothetical protein
MSQLGGLQSFVDDTELARIAPAAELWHPPENRPPLRANAARRARLIIRC